MKPGINTFPLILFLLFSCKNEVPDEGTLTSYMEAKSLYSQGSIDEAKPMFREIYHGNPDFHQAGLMYGKVCVLQGDNEEAERIFQQLLREDPGYPEARMWQIRNCLDKGDMKRAEQLIAEVLEKDSRDPRLLTLKGMLHEAEEKYQLAIESYRKALLFEEELVHTRLRLAFLLLRYGLFRDAAGEIELALAVLPEESLLTRPAREALERITAMEER